MRHQRRQYGFRPSEAILTPDHPLWTGCQLALLGQHAGGLTAYDSSPYSNHGTLTNMEPLWTALIGRNGVQFSSDDDDYVTVTAPTLLDGLHFGCWFNATDLADRRTIFTVREGDYELAVGLRDSEIRASVYDWGATAFVWGASTGFTDTGSPHRVDVYVTTTAGDLWLDAAAASGTNKMGAQADSPEGARIGTHRIIGTVYGFYGIIADSRRHFLSG